MKPLAPLIMLMLLTGVADAQPPKCWKNAQGVTECGTRPPPGVEAKTVVPPKRATVTEEQMEAEAFADADTDAEETSRRAIRQQQCNLARETLAAYDKSDFLYERNADGTRRLLDEEESRAVKERARQDAATLCAEFDGPRDEDS